MSEFESGQSGDAVESLRRLSAAAQRGDESAYRAIHARLDAGLRRFLMKRTRDDAELAEELAQRSWVALWEALRDGRYDPQRSALTTFLYGVGYKQFLQHARRTRSGLRLVNDLDAQAEQMFAATDDPAEFVRACEVLDAVRECLRGDGAAAAELTVAERAILAAIARGESERQLARRLSLAPSTVNSRKQLALKKLQDYLERIGHAPDSAKQSSVAGE
jgi:RNA polymerase sigma factor (sigma-70 family)